MDGWMDGFKCPNMTTVTEQKLQQCTEYYKSKLHNVLLYTTTAYGFVRKFGNWTSIFIILSYTVSKLVRFFLRHSVKLFCCNTRVC